MTRQQKIVIAGAILGAAIGAVGGALFSRGVEEAVLRPHEVSLKSVPSGDIVKLVISILAVLRSIAELGEKV